MTRSISRDSFNESKQYLGVHLQQGRVILDSDWNEGQDIMATLAQRLGQDAFGDGVLGEGFEIQPVIPSPWISDGVYANTYIQAGLPVAQRFPPTAPFDAFDSTEGWALSGQGKLRTSRDMPYQGKTFLRVSDHAPSLTLTKTLSSTVDLSSFQFAHFRFRLNQTFSFPPPPPNPPPPGDARFFIEDANGNRNTWRITGLWNAKDMWAPAAVLPLDLRFSIVDLDLLPAFRSRPYITTLVSVGATPVTWAVTAGSLPAGVTLTPQTDTSYLQLTGTPTANGSSTFAITATSAAGSVTRTFTLRVQDLPAGFEPLEYASLAEDVVSRWNAIKLRTTRIVASTGNAGPGANLAAIKKYGFQVFQSTPSLVWDFDALYLSNRSAVNALAANNIVVGGSLRQYITNYLQNIAAIRDIPMLGEDAVPLLPVVLNTFRGKAHIAADGLMSTQPDEQLYSAQADPNDPPLTTPTGTLLRKDLVYLDVWCEDVTYIEDPELREIGLGGPDSATRKRLRHRVRISEGGVLPPSGVGRGTLATLGSYADRANRLYRVEVDTSGDLGAATIRWSDDNASTIQRVIETIPPGATKVKVEDASQFQPGDFILIRKEHGAEEHRIVAVSGNAITLQQATGAQLALLPAAVQPGFTTFALADHPRIQRWNGFRVPLSIDPNDSTLSTTISLSHGVQLQFGGRALLKGDVWTFRARYLAGDVASGIDPVSRIETLDFAPAEGVLHRYLPLAMLLRDPTAHEPARVMRVRDLRPRAGRIVYHEGSFAFSDLSGATAVLGSEVAMGQTSGNKTFLCVWTGNLNVATPGAVVALDVRFYGNDVGDPSQPNVGDVISGHARILCPAAQNDDQTSIVFVGGNDDQQLFNSEIVMARAYLSIVSGSSTASVSGTLKIIELRNRLLSIDDIL